MKNGLFAAAVLLILFSIGCAPDRAPAAKFIQQAETLHGAALSSTITPDEDLNAYVQEIGKRLEDAAKQIEPDKARGPFFASMKFHLVDVPIVNCFTTGGSHVYVYRGLFDFCRSEDELAAAVAHAYAHALNLDTEQVGIKPPDKGLPSRATAWDFVVNRFTLAQEQAADRLAFRLYTRAGWDPARFEVLFTRLSDRYPGPSAADRVPLMTRSASARALTASAQRSWRQLPVADTRTYDSLSKQATSLRNGDQTTREARLYLLAFPNCILSRDLPEQQQAQALLRPPPPPTVPVEPN